MVVNFYVGDAGIPAHKSTYGYENFFSHKMMVPVETFPNGSEVDIIINKGIYENYGLSKTLDRNKILDLWRKSNFQMIVEN